MTPNPSSKPPESPTCAPQRAATRPQSDIDLLADFSTASSLTLITVGRLQNRLTTLLSANVDLSAPEWMQEPVRTQALAEAVLVF